MNDRIRVSVLTPAGATYPRSTVYMLDGAGNYKDISDWITKGRAGRFFADKNVNVVLPAGASGTFYTDWKQRDAKLGKPMWETFLTKELPPHSSTRSSTGTGAMRSSVCPWVGRRRSRSPSGTRPCTPVSHHSVVVRPSRVRSTRRTCVRRSAVTAATRPTCGGRSVPPDGVRTTRTTIWTNSAERTSSSPPVPAPSARSTCSAGSNPKRGTRDVVTASSSALELGAYRCSLEFAVTLRAAGGIPYTDGFRLIGTHTWGGYWERDLAVAWPTIARGL